MDVGLGIFMYLHTSLLFMYLHTSLLWGDSGGILFFID